MGKMRTHRKRGVELANSEFDPRVGTNAQLRTMSDKQLASYIDRVKRFNLRGNQYYLTAKGEIVSSYRVEDFLRQQRRLDRMLADVDKPFGHFEHKETGERISEYNARIRKGFEERIFRNAKKVYGDIVYARSDLKKLSRMQREALRFGKASTFAEKAALKKSEVGGYVDRMYADRMELLTRRIGESAALDQSLIRDLQGLSKKALISLSRHSDILRMIGEAYEYEKKHDFSMLTIDRRGAKHASSSESVRSLIHAYAKADANRSK